MIRIITDTTCSIPVENLKRQGIYFLPQIITFGAESFEDDYQISSSYFLERLKASADLPGTAAPPPALYQPIFEEILDAGDTALILTPSNFLSGTFRSASLAKEEFASDKIFILDTLTVASGFGQLVLHAKEMADAGSTMAEIMAEISALSQREQLYFLVNTLEYLHKGGRIGNASKLVGSLLQIKPVLTLKDGQIQPFEKVRTFKQAIKLIEDLNCEILADNPDGMPSIAHADNLDEASGLAIRLQSRLAIPEIPIYNAPPAIIVHAGPGLIETSCFRKL
jgi:DegV family protein with EDD domain